MKIRTDFVTNSSSSAFCVSFNMKFRNGEEFSCSFEDQDGDDGFMDEIKVGNHSLYLEKCDLYTVIDGERLEMLPNELGGASPCDIDIWDIDGNVRKHSATDVGLSSTRTTDELLSQLIRLCELDVDHLDESKVDIAIFGEADSEEVRDSVLKNLRGIAARASAWQEAMRGEIARTLKEHIQTWEDVTEATVKFKDNGWGSEALGDYALARMIPDGSRVITGSGSGQKLIASESNRDTIERYIDDSIVQKYVAGDAVIFII